jgi:predicted PurR-regulated permease PerM
VATLFGIYLAAVIDFLSRRFGVGRGLGLTLALLGTLLIIGLVGLLIVPPVINQFTELIDVLPDQLSALEVELARLAEEESLLGRILGRIGEGREQGTGFLDRAYAQVSEFFGHAPRYVTEGIGVVIHGSSVLIMGIYLAVKPCADAADLPGAFPRHPRRPGAHTAVLAGWHGPRDAVPGVADVGRACPP